MKVSEIKAYGVPFHEAAKAYIATMPDDEVVTMQELAERLGRAAPSNSSSYANLRPYGIRVTLHRLQYVYGNPKALRALRKQLAI